MAILELNHIYKSYNGTPVLEDISLSLEEGETIGIAGPNGCGKTTLLKIAAAIEEPDRGTVSLRGKPALVPQDNLLLPWKTLKENILLALKPLHLPRGEALDRLHHAAETLGIDEYLDYYPREVSGGTARKAAIARALVTNPQILLLDEPYTGLDLKSVKTLQKTLKTLAEEATSMVIVSHQLVELAGTVDKIYLLSHRPAKITRIISSTPDSDKIIKKIYLGDV